LQYYVFDLLYLNGKDFSALPLLERKAELETLLKAKALKSRVFYSEHFAGRDERFLKKLCGMQMEGVVSKRIDAPYVHARGTSWLKTKCHRRQEFVIGGFTYPTHAERGVGALLLGYWKKDDFIYAGKVGAGFDNETSLNLRKKLNTLAQNSPTFKAV